ncbi:hypothetical protein NDU88_005145 [Pleurodeles waltl]|uniref:Murine leukemia virus integrase C-terminal domain-containing protein n=1 Tax=Pleurodeles waltl TaxID=8319 RepID=A0AAV7VMC3_PLEWA|nr:hypothetical protein NDU88_005145 [Pleurodeles waltl]
MRTGGADEWYAEVKNCKNVRSYEFEMARCIAFVLTSMRNTPDRKTGLSPHEILMGRAMRLPAVPANALVNITDDMVLDYCKGDVVRSFSQQVEATTLPLIHYPGLNLKAGDWVVRKHVRKTCLEPRWKGLYQVVLTTMTAVKCAGIPNWIHASHTKKVTCPLNHEEALLRVPTTVRQMTAPEQEHGRTEAEPELVEDGSITPVRDEGGDLQEGAEEPIATETAGEPNVEGTIPEADYSERQREQSLSDPEGERVEVDQRQSDLTLPEPVAGPSRENTTEKEKDSSSILKRILAEGPLKGDNWPKRKEVVVEPTIEEKVDATRKEELSEGELNGDRKLKIKRIASQRYAGPEWVYATTNKWQQEFMSFCFDR